MKENYLAKWLNDELSAKEEKEFRNSPEYRTYKRIVDTSSELNAPDFDVEKALVQSRANRPRPAGKVVRMRPINRWLSAAAAVIILLGAGFYYLQSLQPTLEAPIAQKAEAILPDDSEILLNAGSEITYNEAQWEKDRRIELEGEAFFKVAKGKKFTVETPAGNVTVLGTQFNVQQRGTVFIVSCFEGLVRVDYKGEGIQLPAGRSFRVVGQKVETIDLPEGETPGWTRDESAFRSMPLSFVIDEFKRQYDVEVATGNIDTDRIFSGSFSNTNMNLALKSISAPLQLDYEVKGNKVLLYAASAR